MEPIVKISFIYLLSLTMLFSNGCVKEEYDPNKLTALNHAPELAIPLVYSRMTVDDILNQDDDPTDDLTQDAAGLLTLIYKTSKTSPAANDYISFPSGSLIQPFTTPNLSTPIIADSIDLNLKLFNKVTDGSFYFEDPKLYVTFENSFGVPAEITLSKLEAWSQSTGLLAFILNDNSGQPMQQPNILLVPDYSVTPGTSVTTTYYWDKNNSNIEELVTDSIANRYIYYEASSVVNPTSQPPASNPFVTDSSKYKMEVILELPLHGKGKYVVLGDTVPFNMDINEPTGSPVNATEATLVINTFNNFPLEAIMQITFLDSLGAIIETLFNDDQKEIISSAAVGPGPDLRVISPTHKMTEITMDKARLDLISTAKQIVITGSLTTTGGGDASVKIYDGYYIEIKLAARAVLTTQ